MNSTSLKQDQISESVTTSDYIDGLFGNGFYDTVVDEMYWDGGCNTELLWALTKNQAKEDKILLIDEETCDYDVLLHNVYTCSEKGLS